MTEGEIVSVLMALFFIMVGIGYYVCCIFVSIKIMEAKGRSGLIGGIMAVFFGILGVVLCYCLPAKEGYPDVR